MPIKLESLIRESDFIVIGKVVRVTLVGDVEIAEVKVVRTLKGDPTVTRLYYWATPLWGCDVSGATENEAALFLLSKANLGSLPPLAANQPEFTKRPWNFTQGAPFFFLSGAGRGRMRMLKTGWNEDPYFYKPDGKVLVVANYSNPSDILKGKYRYVSKPDSVVFPRFIRMAPRRQQQNGYTGLVRFGDVVSFIQSQIGRRRA